MLTHRKAQRVAIVLTLWDHHGEIIEIMDLRPDMSRAEIDRERTRAEARPGVACVTRNNVYEHRT